MTTPTIITVSPNVGFTAGRTLVEIRGTGFKTWTVPPPTGVPSTDAWPTVEVLFGDAPGLSVAVISDNRCFVRTPPSPVPFAKPSYGEGGVDVTVRNLLEDGTPVAGESVTLANGFRYQRSNLAVETDYARVTRQLIRVMRQQILANVSSGAHPDFDTDPADLLDVVNVAELPAIVLFGPQIEENRRYSTSGRIYGPTGEDFEANAYDAPTTDDLVYTFVGISERKSEALNLQSVVRQFFRRNRWVMLDRDPTDPSKGKAAFEMELSLSGSAFLAPTDPKSSLRSFSGSFTVHGFLHEAIADFPLSDRIERTHLVLPDDVEDSPEPPLPFVPPTPEPQLSTTKAIVTFQFPFGIGVIGDGTIQVSVPYGTPVTSLTPTIEHNGVSVSPDSGVAADFSSPVTYTVTAEDGSTQDYVVTVTVSDPITSSMKIGTNFWYHTPLTDNWSGEEAMVAGVDWSTAYGAGLNGLADTNIWNPQWLAELAPYTTLRFMDWGNTNWSQIVNWSDRMLPTSSDNYEAYIDGDSTPPNPGIAYEWMIDLCNRLQKDLWVCVPAMANTDYWAQLATLIRDKLAPNLRVYVEYSNETWNGTFGQFQYTIDSGISLGLPGSNQWYQGQAFAVYRSLRIFETFETVFGPSAMGNRVVRVFAYGGNMDTGREALRNIYQSSTYNPQGVVIDMLAVAPYIGSSLDGASASIATEFRDGVASRLAGEVAEAVADQAEFEIEALGAYEGGQHLLTNSQDWSANPAIYDEYVHMLNAWSAHFALFMHYTHTGTWTNAADRSSWGALDHTGQPLAEAHKYRAIVDWVSANP